MTDTDPATDIADDDLEGFPWVWVPRERAFSLPRPLRLPKRQRRLARQKLREDA
jgi:hypothetical protein